MRKSESKLQTLVRLLGHREELARRDLAQRHQAVTGASSRQDELTGLQAEYRERLADAGGTGVSAGELRLWRRFNQSLEDVVAMQASHVDRLRRELEAAQSACRAALARRRGGERLEDAEQRRAAELARRQERTAASDRAAQRQRSGKA